MSNIYKNNPMYQNLRHSRLYFTALRKLWLKKWDSFLDERIILKCISKKYILRVKVNVKQSVDRRRGFQEVCPSPREYSWYSFQGHSEAGSIMSMRNSNDTIGNRTRDLRACSQTKSYSHYISSPLNSSPINHTFDIKPSELLAMSFCKTHMVKFLCIIAVAQSINIT